MEVEWEEGGGWMSGPTGSLSGIFRIMPHEGNEAFTFPFPFAISHFAFV